MIIIRAIVEHHGLTALFAAAFRSDGSQESFSSELDGAFNIFD